MAIGLAERGYDVAVHYATAVGKAQETVRAIKVMGRKATALHADLSVEDQSQALIARAVDALGGPLTCLVNNASVFEYDNIRSASRENWDRHMETNLRAPFVLIQNFAAQAPSHDVDENGEPLPRASVVNILDQRVRKPTPEFMSYTISRMALWALTRTAAQALAPDIRVNAIGPGPTIRGHRQSESHFSRQREATILKRSANPVDIVAALGYLISAPAVTGQLICPDGGQHLAWQTPDILGIDRMLDPGNEAIPVRRDGGGKPRGTATVGRSNRTIGSSARFVIGDPVAGLEARRRLAGDGAGRSRQRTDCGENGSGNRKARRCFDSDCEAGRIAVAGSAGLDGDRGAGASCRVSRHRTSAGSRRTPQ